MIYFVTGDSNFAGKGINIINCLPNDLFNSLPVKVYADTETTGLNPHYSKILLLIFTIDNENTFVIDCRTTDEHKKLITHWQKSEWVFHNAQFDLGFIYKSTNILLKNAHCTYQREKLAFNSDYDEPGKYSLATLMKKYLKIELNKQVRNSFINKRDTESFTEEEILYAANDVIHLSKLFELQQENLNNLEYLVYVERKFISSAVGMSMRGIRFDPEVWRKNIKINISEMKKYEELLYEEIKNLDNSYPVLSQRYKAFLPKHIKKGYEQYQMEMDFEFDKNAVLKQINLNSSDHILKIFKACGVTVVDTNANTLKEYRTKNPNTPLFNFIQLLVGDETKHGPCYKFYEKSLSTYGENFIKEHALIHENGNYYIHTEFGLIETKTGRLSSNSPNLQNIPAIKSFRHAFIADDNKEIYTIDFTGCELAICAHQSKCPTISSSINEGTDLHSFMATISYRIIMNDSNFVVSKHQNAQYRNKHKPVLFGILYGAGPSRIASVLNIEIDTAKRVYKALQDELPVLFRYLDNSSKSAIRNRYIVSNHVTKRKQFFIDPYKEDYKIAKEAKNYPMQSTNADLIKEAICTLDKYIEQNNIDVQILLTVHDEIVFQAPKTNPEYAEQLINIMESVAQKYVPGINLKCSIEIGPSWTK